MSLKINVRESGNVVILDLNGRITIGEQAASLRDAIKEHLDSGQKNILLNLAEVSYIDSTGLGQFVGSFATVTSRGGQLKLLNLQKRLQELMQITKLITEVSYIDSTGLGQFVGSFATVTSRGGQLKLLNLQKRLQELMQITKLITVFDTYTNESAAVRSFAAAATAS